MDSEERRFKALDFLLDYSKGTIWWVKDRLWNAAIPNFVVKRVHHPGLSLARDKAEGLYSMVPMAIGTTKNPGSGFPVDGLSEEGTHEGPSYFSVLRPCPLRFNEFGSAEGIEQNAVKPRLTRDELSRLDRFLFGKGA